MLARLLVSARSEDCRGSEMVYAFTPGCIEPFVKVVAGLRHVVCMCASLLSFSSRSSGVTFPLMREWSVVFAFVRSLGKHVSKCFPLFLCAYLALIIFVYYLIRNITDTAALTVPYWHLFDAFSAFYCRRNPHDSLRTFQSVNKWAAYLAMPLFFCFFFLSPLVVNFFSRIVFCYGIVSISAVAILLRHSRSLPFVRVIAYLTT